MIEKINTLKEKLKFFRTEDILGYISTKFLTFASDAKEVSENSNIFNKTALDSPHKQYMYLAGLMVSTDFVENEQDNNKLEETEAKYEELENLVKEITHSYIDFFIPKDISKDKIESMSEEDKIKILTSMEVFTSYYNTDTLRYEEQVIERIRLLCDPFNEILYKETKLNVNDYIQLYYLIHKRFEESLKESQEGWKSYLDEFEALMKEVEKIKDPNAAYQRMTEAAQGFNMENLYKVQRLFKIDKQSIINFYGEDKAQEIFNNFCIKREYRDFQYYNTSNPFEKKPLCWVDEEELFIVHPKIVLTSIYDFLIRNLEKLDNSKKVKYYEKRGEAIEETTYKIFESLFNGEAVLRRSVCEIYGSEEHDLLIQYKRTLIIVEIKSSKVKPPLFNPEKAYKRIVDHFNSKSGIGGGYQQATKLKNFILSKDEVTLYEDKVKEFQITKKDYDNIFKIIITSEQFGPLNINMSKLVTPTAGDDYPWSCNLYDLENLLEMMKFMKKGPDDFIEYVLWRIQNHKRIMSGDELEILETFYTDKRVRNVNKNINIFIPVLEYNLIDKIYFEKNGIEYYHPYFDKVLSNKIGRNEPCPCGSGKKYKKCCLK